MSLSRDQLTEDRRQSALSNLFERDKLQAGVDAQKRKLKAQEPSLIDKIGGGIGIATSLIGTKKPAKDKGGRTGGLFL